MARPKGYVMPEESREKTRRTMMEHGARLRAFRPIREAADSGNERLAVRLLRQYIRRQREAA